jgi:hypothetical protein
VTTVAEGAHQLVAMGKILPAAERDAIKKGALAAKDIANRTGGKMRNLGKKGTDLTASYALAQTQATMKPRPLGAWRIAESGVDTAYLIGLGRGKKRKIGGYIYAAGYSHPVRAPIEHPRIRGRRVWTKTVVEADRVVPPIVNRAVVAGTIGKIFH